MHGSTGQHRVSRNAPPISSRPPSAPPRGEGRHTGPINWGKMPESMGVQDMGVALTCKAVCSPHFAYVAVALLAASFGAVAAYAVTKRLGH